MAPKLRTLGFPHPCADEEGEIIFLFANIPTYRYLSYLFWLAMRQGVGIALRLDRFLCGIRALPRMGRITSEVITGMGVTDSATVGRIASLGHESATQ